MSRVLSLHTDAHRNLRRQITRGIHTDCLLNYETVKYFNGEEHEGERYAGAIRDYQSLEYRVMRKSRILNSHYVGHNLTEYWFDCSFVEPFEPGSKLHHREYYPRTYQRFLFESDSNPLRLDYWSPRRVFDRRAARHQRTALYQRLRVLHDLPRSTVRSSEQPRLHLPFHQPVSLIHQM